MKFATGNQHKREEANAILGGGLERIDLDLEEIQSTNIEEVIAHKAKLAYQLTGVPVFVEDVGLRFEAWNQLPGALIKRFLKEVGAQGLIDQLSSFNNKKAEALCCVGYYDGEKVHSFTGVVKGSISPKLQGETNFGRDPIFIPEGSEKSFAEMTLEEKNAISHRKLAREQVKKEL
ncbi:MAG: non-canonical purine NTP pyrophosphatase, RdgB/HAM1 family [candidate division SR1 bacterium]|nr:MAG: non-canonical purine NTP pyrophosphatase, RdgB/HAM1 family [candidate division SR1 bacterium]